MTRKYFQLSVRLSMFVCVCAPALLLHFKGNAQVNISLNDFSFFGQHPSNWRLAADVKADLNIRNLLIPTTGTGILVNMPDSVDHGHDLYTRSEHGDVDIELDYMMAKNSNSGIYLQGRYEVQLLDSWGVLHPKSSDNGGVYERWDENRQEGHKGYEGYAPRQNVSKAPGLWQHLKISFRAPRFDSVGKKIENARMLRVELNGVLIQENIELFGPTRGGTEQETATGPLRLQGDHGAVAFRNIKITQFGKSRPQLRDLQYTVYKGVFANEPDYTKIKSWARGSLASLNMNIDNLPDSFLIRYKGVLRINEAGEYIFTVSAAGRTTLKINGRVLEPALRESDPVSISLSAGELPFELVYSKFTDWANPAVRLNVAGPGIQEFTISEGNYVNTDQIDPILVDASSNTVLRSFMDVPERRIVHAVSVGSPEEVHYTYDMDNGTLVQIWRGGFLDATPMWHERGDGSSLPRGSVQRFEEPAMSIAKLASINDPWSTDTTGTGFRPKGYWLDEKDRPVFRYLIYGVSVNDAIQVLENRQGVSRQITIAKPLDNVFVRLAGSRNIEELGNGLFLLSDKSYYLKIEDAGETKAFIRDSKDKKELLIPLKNNLKYAILF